MIVYGISYENITAFSHISLSRQLFFHKAFTKNIEEVIKEVDAAAIREI